MEKENLTSQTVLDWENDPFTSTLVVSSRKSEVEFIASQWRSRINWAFEAFSPAKVWAEIILYDENDDPIDVIPVYAAVDRNLVAGKTVYGSLPVELAAIASRVGVVCFTGQPPQEAECGLDAMQASGAVIRWFKTQEIAET